MDTKIVAKLCCCTVLEYFSFSVRFIFFFVGEGLFFKTKSFALILLMFLLKKWEICQWSFDKVLIFHTTLS